MIDPLDPAQDDDDYPSLDSSRPAEDKGRESSAEAVASLALDAAIDHRSQAALKEHPRLIIVKVPNSHWAAPIQKVITRMERAPSVYLALERKRTSGVYHRVGGDSLAYLQQGRSVMYISPDPTEILEEAVLAAADVTIELAAPTPELLRKAIRRVTGGVARGVTAEMAALDLPVILTVVRPDLSAATCVAKLREAVGRKGTFGGSTMVPLLSELPLTDAVRKWSTQTLADLKAVEGGSIAPDRLVFPVLEGPPGTGKTLIAESLSQTAGWTFVPTTVGGWFATGDGALGGVAKNIKAFVDQVMANAPAVGFLDELDGIPNRATMDNRGRDWWTPVVTLFLTEIDRLRKSRRAVMLIGATNYYHHLDSALIRPGRLQQRVSVLPPQTEAEVIAVLRHYLKNEVSDPDLNKLARLGIGATPAMVEGWVKEARGSARAYGRALKLTDLIEQMMPQDNRSPADIRTIALHEIGHAIVAHRLGIGVERVTIIQQGLSGGHTRTTLSSIVPTWEQLCDIVTVALGGRAADMVLGGGANTGAESDLLYATELLRAAFERQGLRENLAHVQEIGPRRAEILDTLEGELARLLKRALAIIEADRKLAIDLAEKLIAERILSGDDISRALGSDARPLDSLSPYRAHEPTLGEPLATRPV